MEGGLDSLTTRGYHLVRRNIYIGVLFFCISPCVDEGPFILRTYTSATGMEDVGLHHATGVRVSWLVRLKMMFHQTGWSRVVVQKDTRSMRTTD